MQQTQLLSLGQEDPLEKGEGTDFNILACESLRTEEAGRVSRWGHKSQT